MTVKFKSNANNKKVFGKLEMLEPLMKKGIRQGMFKSGKSLIGRANAEILRKPKSGLVYIRVDRAGRRRRHVASAPGETHANMTGATRRSLSYQLHGISQLEFGYGVSQGKSAPEYAEFLEFGTPGGRMAARPSLRLALENQTGTIVQHFESEIAKQMK